MRTVVTMGLCLWLAAACAAQQAPAPQTTPPDQKPSAQNEQPPPAQTNLAQAGGQQGAPTAGAGQQEAPAAPASRQIPPAPGAALISTRPATPFLLLDGGWADWGLSGNASKFRQYATPPRGLYLQNLIFDPIFTPQREDLFVSLKDIGQDDYRGDTRLSLNSGQTYLRGFVSQNLFYDPTTAVIDNSAWRTYGLYARQSLTRAFALSYNYREDDERLHFAPPGPASGPLTPFLDQSSQFSDVHAGGKVGGQGFVGLSFVAGSYSDHSDTFPGFNTQSVKLNYLWTPLDTVGLEAGVSRTWIGAQNSPTNQIDTASFFGDVGIGADTDLEIAFGREHLKLPVVQNAWVRDNQQGSFRLTHHFGGWYAQLGLNLRQIHRIRGDQSFEDVPYWTTVNGRLSGKLYRHLRLNLRASAQSLANSPPMITSDSRSLYWNVQDSATARLDGSWPNLNGYLVYTYQHWRNTGRATEVDANLYTAGGVWQISPTVNLFGEFAYESWAGSTAILGFPTLSNFLPDSRIGVVELSWNLPRQVQLSLNYTDYATYNDNPLLLPDGNTHGSMITLNGSYQFRGGQQVGLVVAPWSYSDRVTGAMDYDVAVVMLTGSARF